MAIIRRHIITFLLGNLMTVFLSASSALAEDVDIQFTVFARYRQAGLQYLPGPSAKPETLKFYVQNKSSVYKYKGSDKLSFYADADLEKYAKAKAADPKTALPAPVAVVAIPKNLKEALLLFIPLAAPDANGCKFVIYPVDDSLDTLPAGCMKILNASGRIYSGQIGTQLVDVPHGLSRNVPASGNVELKLAYSESNQWLLAAQQPISIGSRDRICLVLFPPTSKTGIAPIIRTLVDEIPPAAKSSYLAQVN